MSVVATRDAPDSNTTGIYSDTRQAPYELPRSERGQLLSRSTFPRSYAANTHKENLCLQFVENFRSQYVQLFPSRASLLLSPTNEVDQQKFISTFIRPTQLNYSELYDFHTCAKFVANYVKYEPLDDPDSLPAQVMSPATTLQWQVGNAIEMSILLCSMLIANGYNAFVVVGYTTKEVAEDDQSRNNWPGALPVEVNSDDESEEEKQKVRETKFTKDLKRRPRLKPEYTGPPQWDDESNKDNNQETEDIEQEPVQRHFHAWVMIQPSKRKLVEANTKVGSAAVLEKTIFMEPSTGLQVETDDARYLGIEAIFHHHNYYVNMMPERSPAAVNYDLQNLEHWEHVFLSDPELPDEEEHSAHNASLSETARLLEETQNLNDLGESGDQVLDLPASWVSPLTLSRAQFENRYPGRKKVVTYADATVAYFAEYSDQELRVLEVRKQDDLAFDGDQVHTLYMHRHDYLRRKSTFPSTDGDKKDRKVHQWFGPGRKKDSKVEGLRELIEETGISRTMRFYWKAREDGLMKRVEIFFPDKSSTLPMKIIEDYRGREEDRLLYRSATYEAQKDTKLTPVAQQENVRVPSKMAEKYGRNPKQPDASEDVMKLTFIRPLASDGEIWVKYHYSKDCITQPYRIFPKSAEKEKDPNAEFNPVVVPMPFAPLPKKAALRQQLTALIAHEKECLQEVRSKVDECGEILEVRNKDQSDLKEHLSTYDTLRSRTKESDRELEAQREEERLRQKKRKDALAPYIANLSSAKSFKGDYENIKLSFEDAKAVRDQALRDLQERLIQRGHIMQARMDREKEELNRRQLNYQKNLDSTENPRDNEAFAKFCADATWRMKILDERLTKHIEAASDKYAKLAADLAEDGRLAAIYENRQ